MSIDVGPGNVNLGTASNDLLGYLNNPAYAKDPLGLRRYLLDPSGEPSGRVGAGQIDFKKFVSDLSDLDSPLTSAMAVLNVARGYRYLDQLYGSAFTDPQDIAGLQKQAGLLGAFYKIGEARFRSLVPIGVVGGVGAVLRDPSQLAGGKYSHDNFLAINSLLHSGGFDPPDAALDVQHASLSTPAQEASFPVVSDRRGHPDDIASGGFASPARYLSRRVVDGAGSSPSYIDSPPLVPSGQMAFLNRPGASNALPGNGLPRGMTQIGSEQATTLPGLVSGRPMDYSLPSSIFRFPEAPAPGDEDWLLQLLVPRRGS